MSESDSLKAFWEKAKETFSRLCDGELSVNDVFRMLKAIKNPTGKAQELIEECQEAQKAIRWTDWKLE